MCIVTRKSTLENPNIRQRQMSDSPFNKMLKAKNPEVNIDKMLDIFNKKHADIQVSQGLEEIRLPLGCDLNKAMIASIISDYLKE